jgi:hypothetical protein
MMRRLVVLIAAVVGPGLAVGQSVIVLSQEREVSALLHAEFYEENQLQFTYDDLQSAVAQDANPWLADVDLDAWDPNFPIDPNSMTDPNYPIDPNDPIDPLLPATAAWGSQYSEVDEGRLFAIGGVSLDIGAPRYAYGQSASTYRVHFAVLETVTFDLSGELSAAAGRSLVACHDYELIAFARVALREVSGVTLGDSLALMTINGHSHPSGVDEQSLQLHGTLPPGIYVLEVEAYATSPIVYADCHWGNVVHFYAAASHMVEMMFTPVDAGACVNSDANKDGRVDMLDFARMQECFTGP